MRNRAWRRHMEEKVVIRRLRQHIDRYGYYYGFNDINDIKRTHPSLSDFIGTETAFRFKTHTTTKWDSKYKCKYSPNKSQRWRDGYKTREKDKRKFLKILKEYGFK